MRPSEFIYELVEDEKLENPEIRGRQPGEAGGRHLPGPVNAFRGSSA